jgi:hypothetical protein
MLNGKKLDVMEELGATIFSINQSKKTAFFLRMEAIGFSETSVTIYQSTWCNLP